MSKKQKKKNRRTHNRVHPNRPKVKRVHLECPYRCEGCGKTCEMDHMKTDAGDNWLCGSCFNAVVEEVKTWVCTGCGAKGPGVHWAWDNFCQPCDDKTFDQFRTQAL